MVASTWEGAEPAAAELRPVCADVFHPVPAASLIQDTVPLLQIDIKRDGDTVARGRVVVSSQRMTDVAGTRMETTWRATSGATGGVCERRRCQRAAIGGALLGVMETAHDRDARTDDDREPNATRTQPFPAKTTVDNIRLYIVVPLQFRAILAADTIVYEAHLWHRWYLISKAKRLS